VERFTYTGLPARVLFGEGTLESVADEARRLGATRALVLSTPGHKDKARNVLGLLGGLGAGLFAEAVMHTPVEVTGRGLDVVLDLEADCLVAIGGGSTIGLSKALAYRTDLPQIAIPTTYAGSEMTRILGQTEAGKKTTIVTEKVLPEVAIYDATLTYSLPPMVSATSGMNALAHAVEGLYAKDRNPVMSLLAEEAIAVMAEALPRVVEAPDDHEARARAFYGAWLCAMILGSVGTALHHKLCHTLGGSFGLPHAETHTVILPHAASFNAVAAREEMDHVARLLGAEGVGRGLYDLAARMGAPTSLDQLGMPLDGLDKAAELATQNPYWNPRPFTREDIRALLEDAWHGRRPRD
jgi:maleylacetate reductase